MLTAQQNKALTAIVRGRPITNAAKEAKVHRGTVHRWLKSDEFALEGHRAVEDVRQFHASPRSLYGNAMTAAEKAEIENVLAGCSEAEAALSCPSD